MTYENPRQRMALLRITIDLLRLVTVANGKLVRTDRLLIYATVALTSIQGAPMRPHKLAIYLGMPRSTVLRRLEELAEDGWVEFTPKGKAIASPARLNAPEVQTLCDTLSTAIHRASDRLLEIEQKENKTVQSGH